MKKLILISILFFIYNIDSSIKDVIKAIILPSNSLVDFETLITSTKILPENIFKQEINHKGITVVKFAAPWCGPCRKYAPIFQEFANQVKNEIVINNLTIKIKYLNINVDKFGEVAHICNIRPIPTTIYYVDGKPVETFTGVQSKEKLIATLQDIATKIKK